MPNCMHAENAAVLRVPVESFEMRGCLQGTSNCSGLISGNLLVMHKGILDVHAHAMGLTMRLTFKEPRMFSGKKGCKHEVNARISTVLDSARNLIICNQHYIQA